MISVVFNCCRRPNLTELVLQRFIELMPKPYELVVVYDGNDAAYINRIYSVIKPDIFLYNRGDTDRWALIDKAYTQATGNLFMHLENDFYWVKGGAIKKALKAFKEHPALQLIRFEFIPFHQRQCEIVVPIDDDQLCILRPASQKPSTDFQFNLSPGIRRMKFPFGGGSFERPKTNRQMEGFLAEQWNQRELSSGAFMGENFRHIGIYGASAHYKWEYADRFTLRRGERTIARPLHEFDQICDNFRYRQLFMRYLHDNWDKHNKKRS